VSRVTRTENMSRKMKCQAFKLVKTLANNFANRLNKTSLLGIEPVLNWISTLLPPSNLASQCEYKLICRKFVERYFFLVYRLALSFLNAWKRRTQSEFRQRRTLDNKSLITHFIVLNGCKFLPLITTLRKYYSLLVKNTSMMF